MARAYHTYKVENYTLVKQQMLNWASQFNICCFLDNQQYSGKYSSYEAIVGVGSLHKFKPSSDFFSSLDSFISSHNDWIFAHFNYEVRDVIEGTSTFYRDPYSFPDCFLFVPEIVILLNSDEITIGVINHEASSVLLQISSQVIKNGFCPTIQFQQKVTRQEYLESVTNLKRHIMQGDCYEINFCHEFYATTHINPVSVYNELIRISPNPFSAFYRLHDNYLLCASPERYLKKVGKKIISQPIKGTFARDKNSVKKDEISKELLASSAKDKSENVMIVDLVRNDLSKVCEEGSVNVEELFGVYSYPHVHQMISTITGNLKRDVDFSELLKATFPMGSMTGAPKKKVMELIERYERSKRGIYSGTVGYFTPEKDFDFNVVIRSIVYNSSSNILSFHVGSAITASSEAEKEYEECLLKGKAIMDVFSGKEKG